MCGGGGGGGRRGEGGGAPPRIVRRQGAPASARLHRLRVDMRDAAAGPAALAQLQGGALGAGGVARLAARIARALRSGGGGGGGGGGTAPGAAVLMTWPVALGDLQLFPGTLLLLGAVAWSLRAGLGRSLAAAAVECAGLLPAALGCCALQLLLLKGLLQLPSARLI